MPIVRAFRRRFAAVVSRFQGSPYRGDLASAIELCGCTSLPNAVATIALTLPKLSSARLVRLAGNNFVLLCGTAQLPRKGTIRFDRGAEHNLIVLGERSRPITDVHFQGSGNLCLIGEEIRWPNLLTIRFSSDRGSLIWGRGSTSNGTEIVIEGPERSVIAGDDCMFARGTSVRTSDLHAIYDADGKLLNSQADVLISAHCWIGLDAFVTKGVTIGAGAVVGGRSLIARDVEARDLVAGVPAKPLRHQVRWERHRPGEGS